MKNENTLEASVIQKYLIKKSRILHKKIVYGGKINLNIFVLSTSLIAILPLIPMTNDGKDIIPTILPSIFTLRYELITTIYFVLLTILLFANIVLAFMNIQRKYKYKNLIKEIEKLK